jgi:hypothetical protein
MATEAQMMAALAESMDDMDQLVADIKTMIYGESGNGKTVLGMQILQKFTPPDKTIIFVDTARGWVSLNNHPELKMRTKRMQYKGLTQIELLMKAINEKRPGFDNVGGLQFDEFSSIQVRDTHVVMVGRGEAKGEFAAPTQPDMGVTTARLIRSFTPILESNLNVVLTSHIREDELKIGSHATGRMVTRPALMPQLSGTIRGMVHEVLYIQADTKAAVGGVPSYARTLQVMPTQKIVAKTRVGGLTPTVTPAAYLKALSEWVEGSRPSAPAMVDDISSDDVAVPSNSAAIEIED